MTAPADTSPRTWVLMLDELTHGSATFVAAGAYGSPERAAATLDLSRAEWDQLGAPTSLRVTVDPR